MDSFKIHIKTADFYVDIPKDLDFDTSNYELERQLTMVWKTGRETRVLQGGLLGREDNCKNFAGLNGSWKKLEIEWKPAIVLRKIEKILGRKHIFPLAHAIARFSEINCLFSKRRLLQEV